MAPRFRASGSGTGHSRRERRFVRTAGFFRALPVPVKAGEPIAVSNGKGPVEARITRSAPGWPDLTVRVYLKRTSDQLVIAEIRR